MSVVPGAPPSQRTALTAGAGRVRGDSEEPASLKRGRAGWPLRVVL